MSATQQDANASIQAFSKAVETVQKQAHIINSVSAIDAGVTGAGNYPWSRQMLVEFDTTWLWRECVQ